MPDTYGNQLDEETLACIDTCMNCHRACAQTIPYCLQQGGMHASADHIRLMMDCAEICATSAHFMMRGSNLHRFVCGACAEVCERCYEDCARMSNDVRMLACADECHKCMESCRHMSGHMMAA
jgi:hypothetical protein